MHSKYFINSFESLNLNVACTIVIHPGVSQRVIEGLKASYTGLLMRKKVTWKGKYDCLFCISTLVEAPLLF